MGTDVRLGVNTPTLTICRLRTGGYRFSILGESGAFYWLSGNSIDEIKTDDAAVKQAQRLAKDMRLKCDETIVQSIRI